MASCLDSSSNSSSSENDQETLSDSSELSNESVSSIELELELDEDLEPLATEQEAADYVAEVAREEQEEAEYRRRFTGETSLNVWCKFSNCSTELVTKPEECICCIEIDRCSETMEALDKENECITLHPGFRDVCLNRWVLEIAALGLKTKAGKSYKTLFVQGLKSESEFLRSVSYRQLVRLVWNNVGHSKRFPLPCCTYNAIRAEFPSQDGIYHGFEDDEEVADVEG